MSARPIVTTLMLWGGVCGTTSCDDTHTARREELAHEAADYVADVARRDPERAGKSGVWRGLHVRARALASVQAMTQAMRFDLLSPTCRDAHISDGELERSHITLTMRGSREFTWTQQITSMYEAGVHRLHFNERYSDGVTTLPGERVVEMFWFEGTRWMRSSEREDAAYVKDPYPQRDWHALVARQHEGVEALIEAVDVWKRDTADDQLSWAESRGARLGCTGGNLEGDATQVLEELRDVLALRRGRVTSATLSRAQHEGEQGWRVRVVWTLADRGELEAEVWRGRRAMTGDEQALLLVPARVMEAVSGQGERAAQAPVEDDRTGVK